MAYGTAAISGLLAVWLAVRKERTVSQRIPLGRLKFVEPALDPEPGSAPIPLDASMAYLANVPGCQGLFEVVESVDEMPVEILEWESPVA
jgi:hypothetical protein